MALFENLSVHPVRNGTENRLEEFRFHLSGHGDLSNCGKDCPPHYFIEDPGYDAAVCDVVISLEFRIEHKVGKSAPVLKLNMHLQTVSMGTTEKTVSIAG